jgi:hypothetical protein
MREIENAAANGLFFSEVVTVAYTPQGIDLWVGSHRPSSFHRSQGAHQNLLRHGCAASERRSLQQELLNDKAVSKPILLSEKIESLVDREGKEIL